MNRKYKHEVQVYKPIKCLIKCVIVSATCKFYLEKMLGSFGTVENQMIKKLTLKFSEKFFSPSVVAEK